MPELDGFEATLAIRKQEAARPLAPRIPIVALTAHAMAGDRERCIQSGMDGYVTKPIHVSILLDEIARVSRAAPTDRNRTQESLRR